MKTKKEEIIELYKNTEAGYSLRAIRDLTHAQT